MPDKRHNALIGSKPTSFSVIEPFDVIDFVLVTTVKHKPLPIMELSKRLGLAHKNVLNRLNKLEGMDIIDRRRVEGSRAVEIIPTHKGIALHALYTNTIVKCDLKDKKMSILFK